MRWMLIAGMTVFGSRFGQTAAAQLAAGDEAEADHQALRELKAVFEKAASDLTPNGRVAVIDVFPGQPQGDLNRTLYALGLALRTKHGRVYSIEELSLMMRDCGIATPQFIPLDVPSYLVRVLLA